MIVDSHQHFWTLSRGDYPWPNQDVAPIFRDFGPDDLIPLLNAANVHKTVLVQATDTVAETRFLLDIAAQTDPVAGVVGWVDFIASDAVETLQTLQRNPWLKGVRPMLQNISDTDWILQPSAAPVLHQMQETGLCFDALIQPRHLPVMDQLAARYPALPIVVDHVAKPQMGPGIMPSGQWLAGIKALAKHPNVLCKLSGMVTEIGPDWQSDHIRPFAQVVLDTFGPDRVMFGSDWPVVNLASAYADWIAFVTDLITDLPDTEQAQIMGQNAVEFYNL